MILIVVRAVPFSPTQQRRLTQRPDSFDVGTTEWTVRRHHESKERVMDHESKEAGP
jgi:hypothetical protein